MFVDKQLKLFDSKTHKLLSHIVTTLIHAGCLYLDVYPGGMALD